MSADDIAAQLDALEPGKIGRVDDDAKTKKEWMSEWGCSYYRASERLRNGVDNGLMEVVKRQREHVQGESRATICYRFVGSVVPKSTPKK